MVDIDPRFARIAARLTRAELSAEGDAADDDVLVANDFFVDTYSLRGLQRAFEEYGITAALAERGLGDHSLVVTREDPFRHRLELVLSDGPRIMDLRLHLVASVVVVDWLLMQNPRAAFSPKKPRLPGQAHPGTGLGGMVHQLLLLLCKRLGRDGLVNVPEHFHLAWMYRQLGYVGSLDDDATVLGVVAAAGALGLPALAWAVERGCVSFCGAPWSYTPHELFCPLTKKLAKQLEHEKAQPRAGFSVDVDALKRSLAASPVDGLDVDALGR